MGITGLIPFLQKSSRKANIKEFSGGTIAIDAYCWLHKGAFACAEKLIMNEPTKVYVSYCMKYVNMLIANNIKPILVFDGQNLEAKSMTEVKRRQNRESNRRKGVELIRAGRLSEGRNILRRAVDVTHEMALEVMRECRKQNVDCIVAPYEADAQLAYFSIKDIAQVVVTEDSDLLLFGCKTVMFKMDLNGNGIVIENDKLYLSMGIRSDQFSLDKFRLMCILSGCDYVESLPGIGLVKACKFVSKTSESDIFLALDKLAANLNMWTLEVTDEYKEKVLAADRTFRCQLVFDPVARRLVPLTEPRDGEMVVGEVKNETVALEMALGNINPRNLNRVDNYKPQEDRKSSIWHCGYKSQKPKTVLPTIMRFATLGQKVCVNTSPAGKRNIDETEEESIDLLELYKKPKVKESTQNSRYFSQKSSNCLDYLESHSEECDIFAEDEGFTSLSLNSTPQSTELSSSGQSTSTDSENGTLSSSSQSSSNGLKVFKSYIPSSSTFIDKTTDTVGTEQSVFFKLSPKMIVKSDSKKIRVGLNRRKPLVQKQQCSLANFGFQVRPKIEAGSSGSPS